MGAGVIPYSVRDGKVSFLFQTTFAGRKAGYLVDFGGGQDVGEDYRDTAIREFIEETETMYFSSDVQQASRSVERVKHQTPMVEALFDQTLSVHPDWWCRRSPGNPFAPRLWRTFFIEFPHRDIEELNREWEADTVGRFRKRRQLIWVAGSELLAILDTAPDKLWKRVRQLESATETVQSILRSEES